MIAVFTKKFKESRFEECTNRCRTCRDCQHLRKKNCDSRATVLYCDEIKIRTYKCAWCKYFKLKTKEEEE